MSKANIIRTAFNTLAEAHLIESNKARRAELRALRAKHNLPGSNPTSAKIGHLAGKAVAAYKSPWTPAGSKGAHKGITDLAKKYGAKAKKDPQEFSQSSDALDQDADTTYRGVEREEKGEPTSYTTGIKKGILTGRKIIKKAMGENTMNYRQSLRALFEAVIEEMHINESSAARKAAVRAILARSGRKQERLGKSSIKPAFRGVPHSQRPEKSTMATRLGKKVRGKSDPYEETGRITIDGPEEYAHDKSRDPEDPNAEPLVGPKTRKMASRLSKGYHDARREREEDEAREAAEWDEMDREHSAFFRGGRSRGLVK